MIKDAVIAFGIVLALACSFLIAGFVVGVALYTIRITKAMLKWLKTPEQQSEEEKTVSKFMASGNVFVRDPLAYKDANGNNIDDLDETR